jgi:hypothetical protein
VARRAYTRKLYETLLEAYRLSPNNHAQAARTAVVEWRTAKRAWETGWPKLPWARPISKVIAEEGDEARVRARAAAQKAREVEVAEAERRREAAVAARQREEELITEASKNVVLAAKAVGAMTRAVSNIVKQIDAVAMAASQPGAAPLPMKDAVRIVGLYVQSTNKVAYAAEVMVQLNRMDRGAPVPTTGMPGEQSVEDALEELRAAEELRRAYEERAAAGALAVDPSEQVH